MTCSSLPPLPVVTPGVPPGGKGVAPTPKVIGFITLVPVMGHSTEYSPKQEIKHAQRGVVFLVGVCSEGVL